jgi:hypothetical protein
MLTNPRLKALRPLRAQKFPGVTSFRICFSGEREVPVPRQERKLGFDDWRPKFLNYLQTEKKSNPELLELMNVLGDVGKQELVLSIFVYLCPQRWEKFRKTRRKAGKSVDQNLSRVIRNLGKLARDYRSLVHLAPGLRPGILLGAAAPQGFAEALEVEAVRLSQQQKLAKIAFNYKRGGNKADLATLIRLQEIIAEFVRRAGKRFPADATRRLRGVDLADLLEAGKAAHGLPDHETMTDPTSIERALLRFRKHPRNVRIDALLREDAHKFCNKLF